MPSFSEYYAAFKRAKAQENDPRVQLAKNAAIDRMPLNGSPQEFRNPACTGQYVVMAKHRYRPNVEPFPVSKALCDKTRAFKIKKAFTDNEEAKQFPRYVYRVELIKE